MSSQLAGGRIDFASHSFSKYLFSSHYVSDTQGYMVEQRRWTSCSPWGVYILGNIFRGGGAWAGSWRKESPDWHKEDITRGTASVKSKHRKCSRWERARGDLQTGQGEFELVVGSAGSQTGGWLWSWAWDPGRRDWTLSCTHHRAGGLDARFESKGG